MSILSPSSPLDQLKNVLDRSTFIYIDIDSIDDKLICVVCSEPLIEPVLHIKCRNNFCTECLNKCKNPQSRIVCPMCRGDASNSQAPVSLYIDKVSNNLMVECKDCHDSYK
jgi:hypothetical protein